MNKYGLIGKNIEYSFSRKYFKTKFEMEQIQNCEYVNFDLPSISDFKKLRSQENSGYNVTIPYKECILPYLDYLSPEAKEIGAVNTIKIQNGILIGFNTDTYGFSKTLQPLLPNQKIKALILGNGGSSKAIAYSLKANGIEYTIAARNPQASDIHFSDIDSQIIADHLLIINCTPLGTFPKIQEFPPIPFHAISNQHILYDLIYNPEETVFLKAGRKQNATTLNGYKMLVAQAEKSWEIWQSPAFNLSNL